MKYFTQIIVLLLCVTVWIGYEVSAQTTNSQDEAQTLYEDTKSFFTLVDQSDNVQCKTHITEIVIGTNLFEFYGDMGLVDMTVGDLERQGYNVRILATRQPALLRVLAIRDRINEELSSEDIDRMKLDLERLQGNWNSCIENR